MKKQKIISYMLIMIIICNMFSLTSYADDIDEEENTKPEEIQKEVIETAGKVIEEPKLNARSAIIFDRETKTVLYEKNSKEKRPMASTTKIMTAIVTLENADLSKIVTISRKAAGTGGSTLGLKVNDKITLEHLLYGLMLCSGNDSAVAIAETVGGSVEGFASMMNKKAKELGLTNTNFVTPHGLDNSNHYTTALELAKLTDYALKNKKFALIVNTKNHTVYINGYPKQLNNTNELLGNMEGVNGVKTGFTNGAGRCLVTSCTRNDKQIITVVLGDDTKKMRTTDSIKLIEYAFQNFEDKNIEEIANKEFNNWKNINEGRINVERKSKNSKIEVCMDEINNKILPVRKDKENIKIEIDSKMNFEAPVEENKIIGTLKILIDGKEIEKVNIRIKNKIEKKDLYEYFIEIINKYVNIKII